MQTWAFPASFQEEAPGDWVAAFPDVPEAITGGSSLEEARRQAADALDEAILGYLAHGRAPPTPREPGPGEELVALDPVTASRAALAYVMSEQHVSHAALARRLGRSEGAVRRLISGQGGVKIDRVLQALSALGARAALAVTNG